ncbi:hypothetical protein FOA52_012034 [Chlamydomonas sp. UWO 241]|nr:hypothetical protein FOA52_012034 [Chlamydomonas sp. UWO 241]
MLRCSASSGSGGHARAVIHRRGQPEDEEFVGDALLREALNPLGIDLSRFLVAEDAITGEPLGFGQLELKEPGVYELRSLVVEPKERDKGIGLGLVRALLDTLTPSDKVWLVTVRSRVSFYVKFGFAELPRAGWISLLPRWLWFEAVAGSLVARLAVGEPLVALYRSPQGM